MRTFGRVMAGLGVGLAAIGGAGAITMLPPPVLQNAGAVVEGHRQALRQHLPDMPDLEELISGVSKPDCAIDSFGAPSGGPVECATPVTLPAGLAADLANDFSENPPGDPTFLLTRSNEAARRFKAPAPSTGDR